MWKGIGYCLCVSLHSILVLGLPYFDSIPDSLLSRNTHVRRLALRVYYLHRGVVSGMRFRIRKIWSRLPPSRGRVRDISCACEQQQGTIPSKLAVGNVDDIVDISRSDWIAREHFRFLEDRFWKLLETSRRLLAFSKSLQYFFLEEWLWIQR